MNIMVFLQIFMDDAFILYLTPDVIDMSIAIRKNGNIKLPDAIIAATAIVFDLTRVTRNTSDYKIYRG